MSAFRITDTNAIVAILDVFSALDDVRWKNPLNYNLINYCTEDLSADEKLLTHWLCYIMDRQMPFQRIWDIGGYVVSHLVRVYTRGPGEDVWESGSCPVLS